ncbi:hypothetical protein JW935_28700 [candidate division KSB1 bacterium]|nr:hypothetical protein [candidate division KSB1 bacterium]
MGKFGPIRNFTLGANQYQWYHKSPGAGVWKSITGAVDSVYVIESAGPKDESSYYCAITSSIVTDMTLYSRL